MSNIFQQIWDADQSDAGVKPILDTHTETSDSAVGFVKVNSQLSATDSSLRVLPDADIPEAKSHTYTLCRRLFDNYALAERDEEVEPRGTTFGINIISMMDLLDRLTAPMQISPASKMTALSISDQNSRQNRPSSLSR
jgi:poly(U)-specific endoribonuclease